MHSKKLMEACVDGNLEVVNKIIKKQKPEDLDLNGENRMALSFASDRGKLDIVKVLLEHGADPNLMEGKALRLACSCKHLEVVKLLLENGADIHKTEDLILSLAKTNEHVTIVEYLKNVIRKEKIANL